MLFHGTVRCRRFHKSSRLTLRYTKGKLPLCGGDFDAALKSYKRALELDPKLYDAALSQGTRSLRKHIFQRIPNSAKSTSNRQEFGLPRLSLSMKTVRPHIVTGATHLMSREGSAKPVKSSSKRSWLNHSTAAATWAFHNGLKDI